MRRLYVFVGVMVFLLPIAACNSTSLGEQFGLQLDENPPFIPSGAHSVFVDRSKFGQQDNPLENRDAGDVVDDLEKLEGCWGAYTEIPEGVPFAAFLQLANFYHIKFDGETGSYELWQEGLLGVKVAVIVNAKFEISGPGRIRMTPVGDVRNASNLHSEETGEIETFDYDASLFGKEILVTLDGDVMLLQEGSDPPVVYRRLDCPQEADENQNQ